MCYGKEKYMKSKGTVRAALTANTLILVPLNSQQSTLSEAGASEQYCLNTFPGTSDMYSKVHCLDGPEPYPPALYGASRGEPKW